MTLQDLIKPRKRHPAASSSNMKRREISDANLEFERYMKSQIVPVEKTVAMRELDITPEQFKARMVYLRSTGAVVSKMHVSNKNYAYWVEKNENQPNI